MVPEKIRNGTKGTLQFRTSNLSAEAMAYTPSECEHPTTERSVCVSENVNYSDGFASSSNRPTKAPPTLFFLFFLSSGGNSVGDVFSKPLRVNLSSKSTRKRSLSRLAGCHDVQTRIFAETQN